MQIFIDSMIGTNVINGMFVGKIVSSDASLEVASYERLNEDNTDLEKVEVRTTKLQIIFESSMASTETLQSIEQRQKAIESFFSNMGMINDNQYTKY